MENKKEIETIQIAFENCAGITIPYRCIKQLNYKTKKYSGENGTDKDIYNIITNLDCIIENNGDISFNYPWMDDEQSPIQRLNQYNDICYFDIIYKDGIKESNHVEWYPDDFYAEPKENKNQTSKLLRYNKIHIHVEPYIPQYTILEIFHFPTGTHIQDEEGNKYVIFKNEQGIKTIDLCLTYLNEKNINMKFIKIDN